MKDDDYEKMDAAEKINYHYEMIANIVLEYNVEPFIVIEDFIYTLREKIYKSDKIKRPPG